jgi:translation initiation factor 2B subunit (eIF-2B alpha/beta/delta family)
MESIKYEKIFNRLYRNQPDAETLITLSRSGTLLNILRFWYKKNKKIKIIVCESRPKYEGRLLAQDLLNAGIKVELITDAMMSLFVAKSDAAIIGTDSVLRNKNVINKVGSKSLALFCKEHKKPFYVVTTSSKYSDKKSFKPKNENPDEIWKKQHQKLKVNNIYFEEIENKLITRIITD